jgi:hypothetical protein
MSCIFLSKNGGVRFTIYKYNPEMMVEWEGITFDKNMGTWYKDDANWYFEVTTMSFFFFFFLNCKMVYFTYKECENLPTTH